MFTTREQLLGQQMTQPACALDRPRALRPRRGPPLQLSTTAVCDPPPNRPPRTRHRAPPNRQPPAPARRDTRPRGQPLGPHRAARRPRQQPPAQRPQPRHLPAAPHRHRRHQRPQTHPGRAAPSTHAVHEPGRRTRPKHRTDRQPTPTPPSHQPPTAAGNQRRTGSRHPSPSRSHPGVLPLPSLAPTTQTPAGQITVDRLRGAISVVILEPDISSPDWDIYDMPTAARNQSRRKRLKPQRIRDSDLPFARSPTYWQIA